MDNETKLLTVSPSMFRNHPLRFSLILAAVVLGIYIYLERDQLNASWKIGIPEEALPIPGLLIAGLAALKLLVWWIRSATTRLVVTTKQIVRHEGILARYMVQMRHENVQNIYVKQTILQRLMNCGIVGFSSSGQADVEIVVEGIPDPKRIAAKIQEILDGRQRG